MHVLHICVIAATSNDEAETEVESYLDGWGDEDNWRSICGSISQSGVRNVTGGGRWSPDETVEELQKHFAKITSVPPLTAEVKTALNKLIEGKLVEPGDLYSIRALAEKLIERQYSGFEAPGVVPDVFKHWFHADCFDEVGVTHIGETQKIPVGSQLYAVYVDMHT